jgi:hypothetical protein
MSISNLPVRSTGSFDNPDFVHLKSLSDMCKQIILWATAADAQIQVLLAKRAPNMSRRPENPCGEDVLVNIGTTKLESKAPSMPTSKVDLMTLALSLGIPATLLATKDYLNDKARPSLEGIKRTQDLINQVLDKIAGGHDPSGMWAGEEM